MYELSKNKKELLTKLEAKNSKKGFKYKRVSLSPLRYSGGKSNAVGFFLELIPETVQRVVSPFFGGGSFELALNKFCGIEIIGYDIFDWLVNYWQFQIKNPILLYETLKKYNHKKEFYIEHKRKVQEKFINSDFSWTIDDAADYYYSHNLSYGPMFLGWYSSNYSNFKKYENMLNKVKNFKFQNIKIELLSFEDSIPRHKEEFLFLDPPYFTKSVSSKNKMWKPLYPNCNFPIHHKEFDHRKLAKLLKEHKGGFILTYNNVPEIREMYKDYDFYFPRWQYTLGQGETRIGKNRLKGNENNIKESNEIIIFSAGRKGKKDV